MYSLTKCLTYTYNAYLLCFLTCILNRLYNTWHPICKQLLKNYISSFTVEIAVNIRWNNLFFQLYIYCYFTFFFGQFDIKTQLSTSLPNLITFTKNIANNCLYTICIIRHFKSFKLCFCRWIHLYTNQGSVTSSNVMFFFLDVLSNWTC